MKDKKRREVNRLEGLLYLFICPPLGLLPLDPSCCVFLVLLALLTDTPFIHNGHWDRGGT